MTQSLGVLVPLVLLIGSVTRCIGQSVGAPTTVLQDLDNPYGVAVQPGTGHVFVSDSGRGRVVRIVDGVPQEVVVGFSRDHYGKAPAYRIGPLGLVFLNSETLVIGGGGRPDGEELIYVVSVPNPESDPVHVDSTIRFGPLPAQDGMPGEGNFFGVASTSDAIFVTAHGNRATGRLVTLPIRKLDRLDQRAGYGKLTRYLSVRPVANEGRPTAVAISVRGELVVGRSRAEGETVDSHLVFYRLPDGKPLLSLATELGQMTALAYGVPHPVSDRSRLYALDISGKASVSAGLYRLDAQMASGEMTVRTQRIARLDKPTAMAFGTDGALYVTLLGSSDVDSKESPDKRRPGTLVRFAPGL